MHDQNNVFYAIALSAVVLITWQYFFAPRRSQANRTHPKLRRPARLHPASRPAGRRRKPWERKPWERRPQQYRTSKDLSRPRGNRHSADRNASPSIRPG